MTVGDTWRLEHSLVTSRVRAAAVKLHLTARKTLNFSRVQNSVCFHVTRVQFTAERIIDAGQSSLSIWIDFHFVSASETLGIAILMYAHGTFCVSSLALRLIAVGVRPTGEIGQR
jgi:hypothetical protein